MLSTSMRRLIVPICSVMIIIYVKLSYYLPPEEEPTKHSIKMTEPHVDSSTPTITHSSTPVQGVKFNNLYKRGFIIENSNLCVERGIKIKVFIAVFSGPSNRQSRNVIRNTWGSFSRRTDVAVAFLIGSFNNATLKDALKQEQHLYGDIIQTKCTDSYDNLTLKTLSMLDWVNQFCPHSRFMLKTDDDMFIHVQKLLDFIETLPNDTYAMYGKLIKNMLRFKDKASKHYLPSCQYAQDILPPYLSGPAYLIPVHLSKLLFQTSLHQPPFKLEDVFISGVVANSLKIKLVHNPGFYNFHLNINPRNVQHRISLHNMNQSEQLEIWKYIHNPDSKFWHSRGNKYQYLMYLHVFQ